MIADVVKQIIPSEETSNDVFQKTTQFEMESINLNDLDASAQKYKYEKKEVKQVNVLDENLPSMEGQRNLVQWLFNDVPYRFIQYLIMCYLSWIVCEV